MYNTAYFLYLGSAYLIGGIPFGVIVSRLVTGSDVRNQGSGNIGATNVARLMGKKWGILVLFLDGLKGFAVVKAAPLVVEDPFLAANLAALAAVVGHCFPICLKFKGGKGVAPALGVVAALSPTILAVCFVIFAIAIGLSRIVSVGSLAAALTLPLITTVLQKDIYVPVAWAIAALVWWKHRENLKRLFRGQEPKFF